MISERQVPDFFLQAKGVFDCRQSFLENSDFPVPENFPLTQPSPATDHK